MVAGKADGADVAIAATGRADGAAVLATKADGATEGAGSGDAVGQAVGCVVGAGFGAPEVGAGAGAPVAGALGAMEGSHATEDISMHMVLRAKRWPSNQCRQRELPFLMLRVAFTRNIARARQLAKRYSLPSRTAKMLGFAGGPRLSRVHVSSEEMPNAQNPPHCGL